ncbi:MAG TPA: hypothetical protein VH092_10930 [Urbifossiella sp.]|jgi:hypothetical protein|nr:hypothetical protein [Urbifossiella sp.]
MTPATPLPDPTFHLPDPDAIRAAIAAADERARLLRRLLRLRLQLPLIPDDRLATPATGKGVEHVD